MTVPRRKVFCVLSARALPYAEKGIASLFSRASEPVELTLITDEESDKTEIVAAVSNLPVSGNHSWTVHSQREADERADQLLARHAHLRQFRLGHPCWRKLTDPLLYSTPGDEMIILDPDLYFPNRFSFEPTPASGLLLMWQPPSCLLPDDVVRRAYSLGIPLAHHVDIGVAQLRNQIDLDWFDWLVGCLGGKDIPQAMHVEAIVWAAMAMRVGGGYLDPTHWNCYQYRQWKRLAMKLGISGVTLLKVENLREAKCFHASGIAKWFVKQACEQELFLAARDVLETRLPKPYEELTLRQYDADQRLKRVARNLGYYRLMRSAS
ncbi:MAG: hypothetical protein ABIP18_09320 [Steroidobacteraceae bacterium]